jgi:ACS family tartrate transporter-like MFS transporter
LIEEQRILAKAARRLIPFMILLYLANYLDRVNVSFAALAMNADLGLSATAYGFGGGVFFLGYALFEIPSNVIMERVGARAWMFRIMLSWGLVSMATAFATGPVAFYGLRFLLGVAEAGFFPGMVLYMTYWFPRATLARFIAMFLAAIPFASMMGAPISGAILALDGFKGLHGWQWLFLLEGLPSCALAFAVLAYLPDGPESARWLDEGEKQSIAAHVEHDAPIHSDLWAGLSDARVWFLSIADFGIVTGLYGIGLWLPQIIKGFGFSNFETSLVVIVPYLFSTLAMIFWSYSSDRRRERVWHVALAALLAAGGLTLAALVHGTLVSLVALTLAAMGIYSALSTFWTLPPSFLGGTAAAGGIAMINAIGNLGGFLGPTIVGWLKQTTASYRGGMAALSFGLLVSAIVILMLGRYLSFEARAGLFDKYAPRPDRL